MADGCNLYFTEKDIDQVEKSLQRGTHIDEVKAASNILNGRIINNVNDFKSILENPKDPRNKIVQQLLEKSLSNGKLTREDEWKLSNALNTVLDIQDNPQGLFDNPPKHKAPGADSMKHGGELLTTAAIIQKSNNDSLYRPIGGISTSLGNKLYIDKQTDIIGFGKKLPSKYALPSRKKGTIEADTLISRVTKRDPIIGDEFKLIGIDTKYSKSSPSYGIFPGLERQLTGIQSAFRDESIQEFYFVSNVQFTDKFKDRIFDYNVKIFKDRMENDSTLRKEYGKYLNSEERKTYIPEKFESFDFYKDTNALKETAKAFGVPQIGLCEEINYKT
jgi:hypothetical protein